MQPHAEVHDTTQAVTTQSSQQTRRIGCVMCVAAHFTCGFRDM